MMSALVLSAGMNQHAKEHSVILLMYKSQKGQMQQWSGEAAHTLPYMRDGPCRQRDER